MNGIIQPKLIGGLGNAAFQYACTRKYAELIGARFECPDWSGRRIFGLDDPYPSCELPDRNDGGNGDTANSLKWGETNVRIGGYFQFQDWVQHLSRAELRKWFTILPKWMDMVPKRDGPCIAAHVRQGDYIDHPQFCNISRQSYLNAIVEHGIKGELVWIEQDNPMRIKEMDDARLWFLADFIRLMRSNVILRANSTFSWWTAVLSDAEVYSPVVNDLVGPNDVPFARGNHPKFCDSGRAGIMVTDLYLPE